MTQLLRKFMRKQEIKNFVLDTLVEENISEESYLDKKVEIQVGTDSDVVKLKLDRTAGTAGVACRQN